MRDFKYIEPSSLEEVVTFMLKHPEEARILAGGTDLLVKMKRFLISPRYLVNLKTVRGLDQIDLDGRGCLRIGALAKIADVYRSPLVRQGWEPIALTAGKMASAQVRNVATVGGNLCNASPSADFAPIMICVGAEVKLVGINGTRIVLLEDFVPGAGQAVMELGELMTEILIPPLPARSAAAYIKQGVRKAMDIAVVGAAVNLGLAQDGRLCERARIVLGAVAPRPMRARAAEKVLEGNVVDSSVVRLAGQTAVEESRPITDVRGSQYYRRKIVGVSVERAITQALARLGELGET